MLKESIERVVVKYYDALEEGRILGRKCKRCGHIEFPPYLACNACGNLDTEWVELGGEAECTQILAPPAAFFEPDLKDRVGDYWHGAIQVEGADELGSILVNINPEKLGEARSRLPIKVRPVIKQELDTKAVFWEPVDEDLKMEPVIKTVIVPGQYEKEIEAQERGEAGGAAATDPGVQEKPAASAGNTGGIAEDDPIAEIVKECAADAYGVDVSELSMSTDIREDLSSESMKMIVMISGIEDELDVTIEIQEASALKTLADFTQRVKDKM